MENKTTVNGGCGLGTFAIILGIAFIILKLCKVIAWSWVWVLSPLWIFAAICVAVVFIGMIIGFAIESR